MAVSVMLVAGFDNCFFSARGTVVVARVGVVLEMERDEV
jgi:hypothetical protein